MTRLRNITADTVGEERVESRVLKVERVIYGIVAMLMLTACNDRLVYSEYGHTPVAGWEKSDHIKLDVDSIPQTGHYGITLSLRADDHFPFQKLYLNIDQTVYPSKQKHNNKVCIDITDKQGNMLGTGTTYYQYDVMLGQHGYHRGDSIHFDISHNMKREILPGVSDIGIQLNKE